MEHLLTASTLEHIIRFLIIIIGIAIAFILGRFRPEWKSRKTILSWTWTIVAVDIIIMDGPFSMSLTAQLFIVGAFILNVINFIGDRIETIKFKDFSASLRHETTTLGPAPTRPARSGVETVSDSWETKQKKRKAPSDTPPKKK